jgi:hypothetical protein
MVSSLKLVAAICIGFSEADKLRGNGPSPSSSFIQREHSHRFSAGLLGFGLTGFNPLGGALGVALASRRYHKRHGHGQSTFMSRRSFWS